MKNRKLIAIVVTLSSVHFCASSALSADVPLNGESVVHFATVEEGQKFVTAHDMYVTNMSGFDRELRLKTAKPVSEQDYLAYASKQVLPWNAQDIDHCTVALNAAVKKMSRWKLPFPKVVTLIKSTGDDEAHTAHCRGDAVILPVAEISQTQDKLEPLIIHELFHILSRNNPELREKLYAVIGFEPTGTIDLPDELAPRRITNPDAPLSQHAVEITVNGRKMWVTPILSSNSEHYNPQRGGQLFDYLKIYLMAVEKHGDTWLWQSTGGKPILMDPKTTGGYFDRIGRNTNYIIHPEEIMADNFEFLVSGRKNLPSPKIASEIDRILSGK